MKLYYENLTEEERVSIEFPLDASVEQALEIFENLPEDDGSSFGLIDANRLIVHFVKYSQFMWMVDIPKLSENGSYEAIINLNQCKKLIRGMFNEENPLDIIDFEFKSFLS